MSNRISDRLPRPLWIVLSTFVVVTLFFTVWLQTRLWRDFAALGSATNSLQERAAFEAIFRHSNSLAFVPRDASDIQLSISNPDWQSQVATIELQVNGHKLTHRVIDTGNLYLLMGE